MDPAFRRGDEAEAAIRVGFPPLQNERASSAVPHGVRNAARDLGA